MMRRYMDIGKQMHRLFLVVMIFVISPTTAFDCLFYLAPSRIPSMFKTYELLQFFSLSKCVDREHLFGDLLTLLGV